ncbi:MAG: hypothetical protein Q8P83_03120 [bacterium]|nr:hypothetical protein [bacterium]
MAHIIKLDKKEDIVSVIKRIKKLRETEVIFELEKGALLLSSSANMKLMRRTGETMGKTIKVKTHDELGRILAAKAGVLAEGLEEIDTQRLIKKTSRINSRVKPNFSDVRNSTKILPKGTVETLQDTYADDEEEEDVSSPSGISKSLRILFKWGVGLTSVLIIIGLIVALVLPTATITIYARSEPITRDLEVTVDQNITSADNESLTVPGVLLSREVSQTENFPTTGTSLKGTYARGQVTLFNFTGNTYILRAATTTLVAGDKEFVFASDVSGIRPTVGTSPANTDLSSLLPPLSVTAVGVGESFNLPENTKFEVRNQALGNVPEVYAMNAKVFSGGASTATLVLSQEDLELAKGKLIEKLRSSMESDLATERGENTSLLSSGIKSEILAEASDVEVGQPSDEFDLTMIARLSGLAFNQDDVQNLISEQIKSILSKDKYILPDAQEELKASFKSVDLEAGTGILTVHFGTIVAYEVDNENLSQLLSGKTATEIKEILLSKPEVDRVDVEFSPFFVKRAPSFSSKVKVNTILSDLGF